MPVIALGQQQKRDSDAREYGDLLTVADVCVLTGLSAQTVRRCLERGDLPGFKIGRRWFVPKSRLLEMGGR